MTAAPLAGVRVLDLSRFAPAAYCTLLLADLGADVVVGSHRPGHLDRFEFGCGAMTARHPHVVWCSIAGFADFGPSAQQPGHDLTYLGASGLPTRLADSEPTPPGPVVSIPLAATMATTGILAALKEVERTGRGTRLDANMTDSAMWVRSEDVARAANAPGPSGAASRPATSTPAVTAATSP